MPAPLVAAGIGAGVGLLSNIFGSKKPQVSTNSIDPESQDYIRQMRGLAQLWAGRGMPDMDPAFLAAMQRMGGYADAGQMGVNAMTDPTVAAQFMNPFMAGMNPVFDRMREASLNTLNQRATAAGAFGARRGLAQGAALRDANQSQAQFNYQGFNDAMARAMQLASMGFGANQWLGDQGRYLTDRQRSWDIGSLGILNAGYGQPLYTQGSTPNESNMFQSILGGALTGLSFGGGGARGSAPAASWMGTSAAPGYGGPLSPGYSPWLGR